MTSWNTNDTSEVKSMEPTMTEHIPVSISDFSSQYGSNRSRSYVVSNVCSPPEIFPKYGDSTNALVFRTYGPWWVNLPSFRDATTRNFPRQEIDFTSRDFIEIQYPVAVTNCRSLRVYETYNPGALEVVYAGEQLEDQTIRWHRVWKFPEPFKIILSDGQQFDIENGERSSIDSLNSYSPCLGRQRAEDFFPNDDIRSVTAAARSLDVNNHDRNRLNVHTKHTSPPAARLPRIVEISLQGQVPFATQHFRLEFDHSTVGYYVEIDTIILCCNDSQCNVPAPIVSIDE
jgi:hypothetical protein